MTLVKPEHAMEIAPIIIDLSMPRLRLVARPKNQTHQL